MGVKWGACFLTMGFIFFLSNFSPAQDQRVADSLRQIYLRANLSDSVKLELLRNLSFNEVNDFNLALNYAEQLIHLAQKKANLKYEFFGYFQKGNKKKMLGDLDDALEAYLKCITIAKESGNTSREGSAYGAIADIYSISNNHSNAMLYYHKAIAILRQSGNSIGLASAILNAGDEYLTHQDYDSALLYFTESGSIYEKVNYMVGKAYTLGNIGMVYANIGKHTQAEKKINEAILILEQSGDNYPVCSYLVSMSDIYLKKGDVPTAIKYSRRSLLLATKYGLKQQISDASLKLSELYELQENADEAFRYYKNHIIYRDSVNNLETVQKIADQRTKFEVSLKEKEIDLLQKQQVLHRAYVVITIVLLLVALFVLLYFRQRFLNTKLITANERKQHEEKIKVLLNTQETKALQSMVQGRDNERKRLAQELHNHFGSLLATIKINLNGMDEKAIPNHRSVITLVDQACADVRNISHALNMGISENFGLVPALKELTAHLQQAGGLEVEFAASMCNGQMASEDEIIIYRIVQELVSNVLKHAEATKLSILLTCFEEEKLINILVQDNGKGFNGWKEQNGSQYDGIGIASLKQMIAERQGDIKFDSNPASGTTVNIDLPITNEKNEGYEL